MELERKYSISFVDDVLNKAVGGRAAESENGRSDNDIVRKKGLADMNDSFDDNEARNKIEEQKSLDKPLMAITHDEPSMIIDDEFMESPPNVDGDICPPVGVERKLSEAFISNVISKSLLDIEKWPEQALEANPYDDDDDPFGYEEPSVMYGEEPPEDSGDAAEWPADAEGKQAAVAKESDVTTAEDMEEVKKKSLDDPSYIVTNQQDEETDVPIERKMSSSFVSSLLTQSIGVPENIIFLETPSPVTHPEAMAREVQVEASELRGGILQPNQEMEEDVTSGYVPLGDYLQLEELLMVQKAGFARLTRLHGHTTQEVEASQQQLHQWRTLNTTEQAELKSRIHSIEIDNAVKDKELVTASMALCSLSDQLGEAKNTANMHQEAIESIQRSCYVKLNDMSIQCDEFKRNSDEKDTLNNALIKELVTSAERLKATITEYEVCMVYSM
jgi:hypothetical protein